MVSSVYFTTDYNKGALAIFSQRSNTPLPGFPLFHIMVVADLNRCTIFHNGKSMFYIE